jgi:hypothetical protein
VKLNTEDVGEDAVADNPLSATVFVEVASKAPH